MHDATIRIRDRYQFQIKLNYLVDRALKTVSYDLAAYLFVPPSLGVSRENLTKADFYNDLQTFVRLKTPEFNIEEIALDANSPLTQLISTATRFPIDSTPTVMKRVEHQVKLFCCILDSSLEAYVGALGSSTADRDFSADIDRFLTGVGRITAAYRRLYAVFDSLPELTDARETFVFGDEHMSLVVEDRCYEFLQLLEEPAHAQGKTRLLSLVKQELAYRRQRKYPSIPREGSDNEGVVYRRSVLKNYMRSVLLLNARTREAGSLLRSSLFGIAAGVSMMFATAVLFISQSVYGQLTLPVFLALVVSYIFKDRIKELLRIYLSRKLSRKLFDHKTYIYSTPRHRIGVCKESFDFVDDGKMPADVAQIRNRDHITEIEDRLAGERVLRYRKHITLNIKDIDSMYGERRFNGLNDVLRFSLHQFVDRMGAPRMTLFAPSRDGYQKIKADRVYHLNLVLRQRLPGASIFRRYRIVLNRRGIKRIEKVSEATVVEPARKGAAATAVKPDRGAISGPLAK